MNVVQLTESMQASDIYIYRAKNNMVTTLDICLNY